jgi:hypothetical protein
MYDPVSIQWKNMSPTGWARAQGILGFERDELWWGCRWN